jgi:hypothetical protein
MEPEGSLPHSQEPASCPYPEKYLLKSCQTISLTQRPWEIFGNMVNFCGERLLAPRSTVKLEDHTLSAVRVCLFNILGAALHKWKPFFQTCPPWWKKLTHRGLYFNRNKVTAETLTQSFTSPTVK